MLYAVAILSMLGTLFYFGAWMSATSNSDLFISFAICFIVAVLSFSVSNLKDTVKKQEERIKKLEELRKNDFD